MADDLDPVLVADVLARMARGERFDLALEQAACRAAAPLVAADRRLRLRTPWKREALWLAGFLLAAAVLARVGFFGWR